MAKLKAPENCTGLSLGGVDYKVKSGFVTIPDDSELVIAAISHGFITTGDADPEADAAQAAIAAQAKAEADQAAMVKAEADALAAAQAEADAKAAASAAEQAAAAQG